MKKFLSFAAFALLMTATCFSFVACGDDDDDNGGKSKFKTQSFTVKGVTFKMVAVDGGSFAMGSPDKDTDASSSEKPLHPVTLSDFYMGETEVTQALWKAVMDGDNPSYFESDDNRPVEKVSWDDCQTFIAKLNEMLKAKLGGKTFRLPTEAEWEYAARGGSKSYPYAYSGSDLLSLVAWYADNSGDMTHPVGTKTTNVLGLYDMTGNVWEWCSDWYGENYYSSSPQVDPTGPDTGSYRVLRGGCWSNTEKHSRVAFRNCYFPNYRSSTYGFRLAMSK